MPPATGGNAKKFHGKAKNQYQKEKENNAEYAKNHLHPAHNPGNASCATNERPDYLDQPRH